MRAWASQRLLVELPLAQLAAPPQPQANAAAQQAEAAAQVRVV